MSFLSKVWSRIERQMRRWRDEIFGNQNKEESSDNPPGSGTDIPSNTVWLNQNITNWKKTATLNARVDSSTIHLNYDKSTSWPAGKTLARDGGEMVGNAWVFVNLNGVWNAETWEWMRKGQQGKPKHLYMALVI